MNILQLLLSGGSTQGLGFEPQYTQPLNLLNLLVNLMIDPVLNPVKDLLEHL